MITVFSPAVFSPHTFNLELADIHDSELFHFSVGWTDFADGMSRAISQLVSPLMDCHWECLNWFCWRNVSRKNYLNWFSCTVSAISNTRVSLQTDLRKCACSVDIWICVPRLRVSGHVNCARGKRCRQQWLALGPRAQSRVLMELTNRLETDSSAHLDKRNKQHHMSSNLKFDLHSPKALYRLFVCLCFLLSKQHGHVLCLHNNRTFTTRRPV